MIQLSELEAMRDTLLRATLSGVLKVQFTDRAVEYTSADDRRKALEYVNAEIAKLSGTSPASFSLAVHSRD